MAANPLDLTLSVVTLPLRIAARVVRTVTGTGQQEEPPQHQPRPQARPRGGQRSTAPKDLDDVSIARKVESVVFRDRRVVKGKIDVNVADGVVWLRGEAKTPDLIKKLEARTREIPEVLGVENLLRLPKTPAPTRADAPASQRKTRRSPGSQAARKVRIGEVTAEEQPTRGEPSPTELAREGRGRPAAPLGSDEEGA